MSALPRTDKWDIWQRREGVPAKLLKAGALGKTYMLKVDYPEAIQPNMAAARDAFEGHLLDLYVTVEGARDAFPMTTMSTSRLWFRLNGKDDDGENLLVPIASWGPGGFKILSEHAAIGFIAQVKTEGVKAAFKNANVIPTGGFASDGVAETAMDRFGEAANVASDNVLAVMHSRRAQALLAIGGGIVTVGSLALVIWRFIIMAKPSK